MEACAQTSALLTSSSPEPTWTMRLARPAGDGFRMAHDLRGVPKSALQIVFGKTLGRRIWDQSRAQTGSTTPRRASHPVADADISMALVEYLSNRAAETLGRQARRAKAIGLKVSYEDGESIWTRAPLARPCSEAAAITAAATAILRQLPASVAAVKSLSLTVTTVEVQAIREQAPLSDYPAIGASSST
jgi:impB/mucB/samB family C-terminal domain